MRNWTLVFLLLFLVVVAPAQYLTDHWDRQYDVGDGVQLHALIQSMNGWLVAVGESRNGKNGKDGLFLILDVERGDILYSRNFGEEGAEVLYDVVQLPDGGFYLAGYTTTNSKGKEDAWLLRVDEHGELLEEMRVGTKDAEYFTHINLFSDGKVLLTGQKGKKQSGEIWLTSVENMQVRSEVFIGDGHFQDVIGTSTTRSSTAWLYGNTTGKKGSRAGKAWMIEVDPFGNIQTGSKAELDSYDFEVLSSSGSTPWENVLLGGTSKKGRQMDAWIIEVDDQGNELMNITYGDRDNEFGRGAIKTIFDKYLLAREVHSPIAGNGYENKLILMDEGGNESEYIIPSGNTFLVKKMLYAFDRRFIVAGESYQTGERQLRIMSLEEDTRVSIAKSGIQLECSAPRLQDDNRNGVLEVGERAAIVFEIINTGRSDIIDGTVEIVGTKRGSDFETIFFSFLPSGGKRPVSIPVNNKMLNQNSYDLEIVVKERGKKVSQFPFTIEVEGVGGSNPSGVRLEIITEWETKYSNSAKHNNVDVRISEGNVRVDYEALSPYQLKDTDFRVRNQDRAFEDQKARMKTFDVQATSYKQYRYNHTLSFDVPLDTGENKIIIEIYHKGKLQKTDTLSFLFLPEQPNLHVVLLAPTTDLEHNISDALDFGRLMKAQEGRGYFKDVFIDTLVSYDETKTQSVRLSFANLRKRSKGRDEGRRSITENDVLVVFISSHGLIGGDGRFKIMPSDYVTDKDLESIFTIDYENDILGPINDINCKKLIFIDACHSGAAGAKAAGAAALSELLNELNARAPGLLAISSSKEGELSYENEAWGNGAFTEAIIEAFEGEPVKLSPGLEVTPKITMTEDGLQLISVENLFLFLQQRVPNLVSALGSKVKQNPDIPNKNESLMQIKFLLVD